MKKTILIICAVLLLPVLGYSQQTYAPTVIDMRPTMGGWVPAGTGGSTMARNVPVTIRCGTITKVLNSRLTPTALGLAALSSGMLYDAVKAEPNLFPETKQWLQDKGIEMGIETGKYTYPGHNEATPVPQSQLDQCLQTARASRWPDFADDAGFDSYSNADKERTKMIFNAVTQKCYGSVGGNISCPGLGDMWYFKMANVSNQSQPMTNWNSQTCDFKIRKVLWAAPTGTPTNQYTTQFIPGTEIPVSQVIGDTNKWITENPNSVPVPAQKAIDEMLQKLSEALRQNTDMLQKSANETETLRKRLTDVLKNGIPPATLTDMEDLAKNATPGDDQTTDITDGTPLDPDTGDGSGGGSGEAVCGGPGLPPCDVTGNWNDSQNTPADVSQTGIDTNENNAVIGDTETALGEQKTILQGIMDDLWQAINGLVGRIMAEINRWIGENPTGSCSISGANVFGGNFALSLCDIDLSGWRDCLIAAFGIISAVALISRW